MENIRLNVENALPFLSEAARESYLNSVKALSESLEKGTCAGKDYLGWLHLPSSLPGSLIDDIKQTAAVLRNDCDVVVVAGIGGSYLGARAVIEALNSSFTGLSGELKPALVFAGHNLIAENGALLSEAAPFGNGRAQTELDMDRLLQERIRNSSFSPQTDGYTTVSFHLQLTETSSPTLTNGSDSGPEAA